MNEIHGDLQDLGIGAHCEAGLLENPFNQPK